MLLSHPSVLICFSLPQPLIGETLKTFVAREVEKKEIETKLSELKKLMEAEKLHQTSTKLLLFTEAKDTLEYPQKYGGNSGFGVREL